MDFRTIVITSTISMVVIGTIITTQLPKEELVKCCTKGVIVGGAPVIIGKGLFNTLGVVKLMVWECPVTLAAQSYLQEWETQKDIDEPNNVYTVINSAILCLGGLTKFITLNGQDGLHTLVEGCLSEVSYDLRDRFIENYINHNYVSSHGYTGVTIAQYGGGIVINNVNSLLSLYLEGGRDAINYNAGVKSFVDATNSAILIELISANINIETLEHHCEYLYDNNLLLQSANGIIETLSNLQEFIVELFTVSDEW